MTFAYGLIKIYSVMNIQLSDHFTAKKLIRFVLPSIVMMIFTSIYSVVDGFFVSNYTGKTPFAAVNLIMPFIMVIGALGFMFGTGGSALVSKTMGEGNSKKANELFSLIVYAVLLSGILLSVIGELVLEPVSVLLGADEAMLPYCVLYGRISFISMPFFMLQNVFQSFFVTAERPRLGLAVTVLAGVNNMVLDFLLVGVLGMGVRGAAIATMVSEFLGGGIPLIYFFARNSTRLRLGKTRFDGTSLLKACTNGASELMTNLSMSLVNMVYNHQLIRFFGEDGVAAYGVIMYVNFIFISVFVGYAIGVAPIVGYSYGAENREELKNIFKKSNAFNAAGGMAMLAFAFGMSSLLAKLFVSYDAALYALTLKAFRLYITSYLLAGFNIFASAFFTALNNGAVSAAISFVRTLLFQIAAVFLLPLLFGTDAIWLAMTAAEILSLCVSAFFILTKRKQYGYI